MTAEEAGDLDGINLEIAEQSVFPTRVYAIPKNQQGATTPVKLAMRVVNKTSSSLCFNSYQPFIPELLAANGQALQRFLVKDEFVVSPQSPREFERWRISPGFGTFIPQTASFHWQDNQLLLMFSLPSIGLT